MPAWAGGGIATEIQVRMHTSSDFRMLPNVNPNYREQTDGWTELSNWTLASVDALASSQALTPMQSSLGDAGELLQNAGLAGAAS